MKDRSFQVLAVLMLILLAVAFLAACETSTAPQPTATAKQVTPATAKTPGLATTPSPGESYPNPMMVTTTTPYP